MENYVIFTDSGCDIHPQMLKEWGVPSCCLTFRFHGDEREYTNDEMSVSEFYQRMRQGGVAKTSAVATGVFAERFEEILKEGSDILYIGFSTGLSTTFNSARLAAEQLKEKYPDRKILCVDSLAASAGQGLLVYLTLQKKKEGATLEEAAAFAEEMKWRLCIWFTVDDLVYLKRGGRISPTAAFVGNMLGIKPVLYMDNEGHLINVSKVRGRKTSIAALANQYGARAVDLEGGTIFISHADCKAEADLLAQMLKSNYGASVDVITDVGTVIGAHSGPGTIALFFVGKER